MEQNESHIPIRQQPSDDPREGLLGLLRLVAERVVRKLEDAQESSNANFKNFLLFLSII